MKVLEKLSTLSLTLWEQLKIPIVAVKLTAFYLKKKKKKVVILIWGDFTFDYLPVPDL